MSLLFLAAAAAAPMPSHSVQLDHRGGAYQVDYRAHVETGSRVIGIAPPTRQSTQRCVMTATVTVERTISGGEHAMAAKLPGTHSFTRQLPGDCLSRDTQLAKLVDDKSASIAAHLAQVAVDDRHHALAAIDAAHHFAAN